MAGHYTARPGGQKQDSAVLRAPDFLRYHKQLIKPWATTGGASYDPEQATDYYLNLDEGELIDSTGSFLESAWGSQFHVGLAGDPGKFVVGESGLLGFEFQEEAEGPTYYGWLRFTPDNDGMGTLMDWAFNDTAGEGIQAGLVPEPSSAVLLTLALSSLVRRRRGSAPSTPGAA